MAWCVCLPVFGANCPSLSVYRVVSVSLTVEGIDCLCGQPTSTKGPVKGQTVIASDIIITRWSRLFCVHLLQRLCIGA